MRVSRRGVFLAKLLLGLALIAAVIQLVDFRRIIHVLVGLDTWYLLAAVVLIGLDRLLMAYKWNLLLLALGIAVPFRRLLQTYSVAPLSGLLLPSTVAGDLFRLYSLSRFRVDNHAVLASIVVERVLGFLAILALACLSFGLTFYLSHDSQIGIPDGVWSWLIGASIALAVGVAIICVIAWVGDSGLAARLRKRPLWGKLHRVYLLSWEYRRRLRTVRLVFGWTLVEQMAPVLSNVLLVRALHIDVSLWVLCAVVPLIILAIRLPVSLDGLGVQEGLYVALLGLAGVSASEAFLLSTLARVLPLLYALPWGVHFLLAGRPANLSGQLNHPQTERPLI